MSYLGYDFGLDFSFGEWIKNDFWIRGYEDYYTGLVYIFGGYLVFRVYLVIICYYYLGIRINESY